MASLDRWTDGLLARSERLVAPADVKPDLPHILIHIFPVCAKPEWEKMVADAATWNAATAEQEGGLRQWVEIGEWEPPSVRAPPPSPPPLRLVRPDEPSPPPPYKPGTGAEDSWYF